MIHGQREVGSRLVVIPVTLVYLQSTIRRSSRAYLFFERDLEDRVTLALYRR